jgi:hypothetical protein
MECSFRFQNEKLNRRLVELLRKSNAKCLIDRKGVVRYPRGETEVVENDVICEIRSSVFPRWQLVFCPRDWLDSYKNYMLNHGVPFEEELSDDEVCFLIPRGYRPHSWKLTPPEPSKAQRAG